MDNTLPGTLVFGFTGTRTGMTQHQQQQCFALLVKHLPSGLHHGDCVGADEQAHLMAQILEIPIYIHPPTDPINRAFCQGAQKVFSEEPYLTRNKHIVQWCDVLIATPETEEEIVRSGTWSTIRYAKTLGREYIVIPPNP